MVTDFQFALVSNPERLVPLKARAPHFLQGILLNPGAEAEEGAAVIIAIMSSTWILRLSRK